MRTGRSQPRKAGRALAWSWRLLVAFLAAVLVLGLADRAVRESPHLGFAPANAQWVVSTNDLPSVWRGVEDLDAYRTLAAEIPAPLNAAQLELRRLSGVRFTPARWSLWFGSALTFSAIDGGYAAAVYPGILGRCAGLIHRQLRSGASQGRIVSIDPVYYAWRERFLIIGTSEAAVRACLAADARIVPKESKATTLRWRGAAIGRPFEAAVDVSRPPTAELVLDDAAASPPRSGIPSGPWPSELARIQGVDLALVRETIESIATNFLDEHAIAQVAAILDHLPPQAGDAALVLTGIEMSEVRVLVEPEFFLAARLPEPSPAPADSIPFRWDDMPGWVLPWWGESFTLCSASSPERVFFANNQAVMSECLPLARSEETDSPARVFIDWTHLSPMAGDMILGLADYELLGRMNRQDADREWMPYTHAAAALGQTILTGNMENGKLVLRGRLTAPASVESGT